ncbi:MAG TPA: NAD-dependent epimerase/dehydratase family protein [Anaerolineae bacterium]|nr:NAD-dependent epimerase/dehydratase family protein [Anaerolineae bacterium]
MKYFITGATGFIGGHLVAKLIARGDQLTCLVRNPDKAANLAQQGVTLVKGDVSDRAGMREAMRGVDGVFHIAALYKFGLEFKAQMAAANVEGTRHVLETALEANVPKIVYTSTVGVFGNTHGQIVDETYRVAQQTLRSEYERTKWAAHYEVAVPLQQQGAPLVMVQPGGVTGPDDTSALNLIYDFYLRRMPVMMGPQAGVTIAHVDDIAEGHLLAMEKGRAGESYILAGPSLTYKQMMEMWQTLCGVPVPKVWLPGWTAAFSSKFVAGLERLFKLKTVLSSEALITQADYTFYAASDKAIRELGWQPRPLERTFKEVLDYKLTRRKK